MSIYVAELVCPNKHMLAGIAGEYATDDKAKVLVYMLKEQIRRVSDVPEVCPKCGQPEREIELSLTSFASVEEFYIAANAHGHNITVLSKGSLNANNN